MELFRLFGSIIIDDQEAIKAITGSEKVAKGAKQTFDNMADAGYKIGTAIVKGAALAGAALGGLVIKGVKSADDMSKALNGLEASTGLTDDATNGLKDTLMNIYKNNYGESFDDIAGAMAEVYKQTDLVGDALEEATTNALILRDTFGFEVQESTRAANMLMQQFGYTSEEAFNLIAQGAQNGLDKNGDLLDSINEYSVHFEQLGLSGEEMFNALLMGAENGAFSIDKVGDAFKEFGIRVKDGSEASKEAFKTLGLNADDMTKKFAAGGDTAEEAYYQVYDALVAMDDPVKQNAAGVALFGTMWEDLGTTATLAAMGLADEFNATRGTMEEINSVKYDSVGEAISGIGRQFETGVLIPIGEKVLPKLNEFAQYIQDNMPQIQATIETAIGVAGDIFDGLAEAIQWVIDNSDILIPIVGGVAAAIGALVIIGTITKLMNAWKATTFAVTLAQSGLSAALMANPIGLVIAAIGALVAAGIALYMNWDTVKEKAQQLWEKVSGFFGNILDFVKTNWQGLLLLILNPFAGAFKLVYDNNEKFRQKIDTFVQNVKTKISDVFGKIKDIMSKPFEKARDTIGGIIEKIKGFFDFEWKLPKLKLPKLSISGKFSLLPPSVPKFDIKWNAKGAIFDAPTIFGTQYGYQGVGEAGPEAVAPISTLMDYVRAAVREANGEDSTMERLLSLMSTYLPQLANMKVFLDTGEMVGRLQEEMNFKTEQLLGGVGIV